jgi:Late competence development protein ComFB.
MNQLKNVMEDIVFERMNDLIKEMNCCNCDICRNDIASYALNRLPAHYSCSNKGALITKVEASDLQFGIAITSTLAGAIQLVKQNPHH